MPPYLDLFLIVVVLLETGTSDGRRLVVGGIEVKITGREVSCGRWLLGWLEAVQIGVEAARGSGLTTIKARQVARQQP